MKFDLFTSSDLRIVEFNTTAPEQELSRVNEQTLFLESSVFNIFLPCFENVKPDYNYFGSNCFSQHDVQELNNKLIEYKEIVERIASDDEFLDFVSSKMLSRQFMMSLEREDKDWIRNWKTYTGKLADVNRKLIRITDNCIEETRVLWVTGY